MTSGMRKLVAAGVVGVLVLAGLLALQATGTRSYTLEFAEAKGIYVGDDVTILSVPVGRITSIDVEPDKVQVGIEVDADHKLPADVEAAIISKSLVSVRAVALQPAYQGGPQLADGATVPMARTSLPVEWDDVKQEVVRLTKALGPEGANEKGAASELVSATARLMEGQGESFNDAITTVSDAAETLAEHRGDFFATIKNINVFVQALKKHDAEVRAFEQNLAAAGEVLTENRESLKKAVKGFRSMSVTTRDFLAENAGILEETLASLEVTSSMLSDNRQTIANLLQNAPPLVSSFYNIMDPRQQAITGALAIKNLSDPAYFLCAALLTSGDTGVACHETLWPIAKYLKLNAPPLGINVLTGNGVGPDLIVDPDDVNLLKQGRAGRPAAKTSTTSTPDEQEQVDLLTELLKSQEGKSR